MRTIVAACLVALACSSASPRNEPPPAGLPSLPPPDAAVWVTAAPPAPLPPGCMRQRTTHQYRCSGVPPGPGEANSYEVTVCDLCLSDADCAAKPGGRCVTVGAHMCAEPQHLACKYPDPACGGQICPEPKLTAPPAAPPPAR
jgi:hypothetical protein